LEKEKRTERNRGENITMINKIKMWFMMRKVKKALSKFPPEKQIEIITRAVLDQIIREELKEVLSNKAKK